MSRHTLACAYGFAVRVGTIAVVAAALAVAWRLFHPINPVAHGATYPERY